MGARTAAITNLHGTQITREVDRVLYTRAGMEMGVAASKTFTSQVVLFLVALKLAEVEDIAARGDRASARRGARAGSHRGLSRRRPSDRGDRRSTTRSRSSSTGRYIGLPVCTEGALKLKEICTSWTEAYSAGR